MKSKFVKREVNEWKKVKLQEMKTEENKKTKWLKVFEKEY